MLLLPFLACFAYIIRWSSSLVMDKQHIMFTVRLKMVLLLFVTGHNSYLPAPSYPSAGAGIGNEDLSDALHKINSELSRVLNLIDKEGNVTSSSRNLVVLCCRLLPLFPTHQILPSALEFVLLKNRGPYR